MIAVLRERGVKARKVSGQLFKEIIQIKIPPRRRRRLSLHCPTDELRTALSNQCGVWSGVYYCGYIVVQQQRRRRRRRRHLLEM